VKILEEVNEELKSGCKSTVSRTSLPALVIEFSMDIMMFLIFRIP
jgi:hypothetical protein